MFAYCVLFTIPDPDRRSYLNLVRDSLKKKSCLGCEKLSQFIPKTKEVKVFEKDIMLSLDHQRLILSQETKTSTKMALACEGCLAYRLKQIATGYIKGRRFKQP